jgi:hypothetical protein
VERARKMLFTILAIVLLALLGDAAEETPGTKETLSLIS